MLSLSLTFWDWSVPPSGGRIVTRSGQRLTRRCKFIYFSCKNAVRRKCVNEIFFFARFSKKNTKWQDKNFHVFQTATMINWVVCAMNKQKQPKKNKQRFPEIWKIQSGWMSFNTDGITSLRFFFRNTNRFIFVCDAFAHYTVKLA
jgi:hypothetical protein